jgi:hypothetical protein
MLDTYHELRMAQPDPRVDTMYVDMMPFPYLSEALEKR